MRFAGGLLLLAGCTAFFDLSSAPNGDVDSDGRPDLRDNCPDAPNRDQSDNDDDGIGDACDECLAGGTGDADQDGIPDGCDACDNTAPDTDGNGIPEECDLECKLASNVDQDHDGIDDACDPCIVGVDPDDDGDGTPNACDRCALGPEHDEDLDGVMDACDNCPGTPNPDQTNVDLLAGTVSTETVGNACDIDALTSTRREFDAFVAERPAWDVRGAGWMLDPATDEATLSIYDDESVRSLGVASGHFAVRARVNKLEGFPILPPTAGDEHVMLTARLSPALEDISCTVAPGGVLGIWSGGGGGGMSAPVPIDTTQPFVMSLTLESGTFTCAVAQAGPPLTVTLAGQPTVRSYVGGIGGSNIRAWFAWYDFIAQQ